MIRIDGDCINDWATFHEMFAQALGFPDFYGRNMNAWIDCMSFLGEPNAGMSSIHVHPGEVLSLVLDNASSLRSRCPEQFQGLVESAAFVNMRVIKQAGSPLNALAFDA